MIRVAIETMILVKTIDLKRLVYSLDELTYTFDWSKPTTIIGDGESKVRYLFNRKKVNVFGINRAVKVYPADCMITGRGHFDELNGKIPYYIPFGIIERSDGKKYQLINGANAVVFLSFVVQVTQNSLIFLQGFDFSRSDQKRYNWNNQVIGFKKCNKIAIERGININITHYNRRLDFLNVSRPPDDLIL